MDLIVICGLGGIFSIFFVFIMDRNLRTKMVICILVFEGDSSMDGIYGMGTMTRYNLVMEVGAFDLQYEQGC